MHSCVDGDGTCAQKRLGNGEACSAFMVNGDDDFVVPRLVTVKSRSLASIVTRPSGPLAQAGGSCFKHIGRGHALALWANVHGLRDFAFRSGHRQGTMDGLTRESADSLTVRVSLSADPVSRPRLFLRPTPISSK